MNIPTLFIPTLDISEGKAVIVKNGSTDKIIGDPLEKALFLSITKNFQAIDIDRAKGTGDNKEIIKTITALYPCYVGGGIRTYEDALEMINSGARRVIISTAADELINKIPKDRLILAIDIDENMNVMTHGRNVSTSVSVFDILTKYQFEVEMISITFHHTEGTISGIPIEMIRQIKSHIKNPNLKLTCGGGISSIKEIETLAEIEITPHFGAGFWRRKFTLGEVFRTVLNAKKQKEWIINSAGEFVFPCIVQNVHGIVLSLVNCTLEAIRLSVDMRIATFYSKDRENLWIKGATSGNFHKVLSVHLNCDRTCMRMVVDGDGKNFCHLDQESCFGYCDPARGSMKTLQYHINNRLSDQNSYVFKMMNNQGLIQGKILEQSQGLITANTKENIISEASDLLFFTTMFLTSNKISIELIEKELLRKKYTKITNMLDTYRYNSIFKIGIVVGRSGYENVDSVLNYLSNVLKINISKVDASDDNYVYESPNHKLQIIPINIKDVSMLINNNFIDAVVSYEDIITNYDIEVKKIDLSNRGMSIDIAVIMKDGVDMSVVRTLNKSRKILVMTEYLKLTTEWVAKNNLNAKIIHTNGNSMSYLTNNLCDICVCISNIGSINLAIETNKLKVEDILASSFINLFVSSNSISRFNEIFI